MGIATVLVFLVLLGATLAFVGWPLLQPALAEVGPSAKERRRTDLHDEKDRLLNAVRDLEHDHQTGKMDDADFESLTLRLKSQAAQVLKQIDVNEGRRLLAPGESPEPAPEAGQAGSRDPDSSATSPASAGSSASRDARTSFCTGCGREARPDDSFCGGCGTALRQR